MMAPHLPLREVGRYFYAGRWAITKASRGEVVKRDVQSDSHSHYEPLLVCIPTTTGLHSNHYWSAFEPLLVHTPTTTGSHLEVVVARTPLLYALMLYASRGSDFTIYKNKSSPCAKSFAQGEPA